MGQPNVSGGSTLEAIADYYFLIKEDPETARQALEKAYVQNPLDLSVVWKLGIVYQKLGREEEGSTMMREALKLFTGKPELEVYTMG